MANYTMIHNGGEGPLSLPYPYTGVIRAGGRGVVADDPATVVSNFGGTAVVAGSAIDLTAVPDTTTVTHTKATSAMVPDGSIGTNDLAAAAVTSAKVEAGLIQKGVVNIADPSGAGAQQLLSDAAVGAGFAVDFRGAVVNIHGGTANYDQNQNYTINLQQDGGGAAASTILANFMNGGVAGKTGTLKAIATDYAMAAGKGLALKTSAAPKNVAGDRQLQVTFWYVLVPVLT